MRNKPSLILYVHEHTGGLAEINGIKLHNLGASEHTKVASLEVYEHKLSMVAVSEPTV